MHQKLLLLLGYKNDFFLGRGHIPLLAPQQFDASPPPSILKSKTRKRHCYKLCAIVEKWKRSISEQF